MYQVLLKSSAQKELRKLPGLPLKKMAQVLDELGNAPRPHGCKKLLTSKIALWRIRIGNYRMIYHIDDHAQVVEVLRIAHRREVYN